MAEKYSVADMIPATAVVIIGAAELAHLCGAFLHKSFGFCTAVFGAAAAAAVLLTVVATLLIQGRRKQAKKKATIAEWALLGLFLAVVATQILFLLGNREVYRQGDMTVETVGSFLQTDAVYQVNPMTGNAYQQGIPSRLRILCLPTLYGALCSLLGLSPQLLVWRVVPLLTLTGCYGAYSALGSCLFSGDRRKKRAFLLVVSLLIWAGTYLYGMDGFGILYCGWRGVTIRNAVLLPWVVALTLRKRWFPALLCIVAEACVVWTLYGMGACLFVALGLCVAERLCNRKRSRSEKLCGDGD